MPASGGARMRGPAADSSGRSRERAGAASRRPKEAAARRGRHARRRCGAGRATASSRRRATRAGPAGAVAQARVVARLRERGHTLDEIRDGARAGRARLRLRRGPAAGASSAAYTLEEAAARDGPGARADRAHLRVAWASPRGSLRAASPRTTCSCCATSRPSSPPGFPLVALLQLVRVYGQALAQMADAEVRLFHLYVHEPLMREGVPGLEMAEEMEGLARDLLPLASPIMDHLHQRFLAHFVEQDVDRAHGGRPRRRARPRAPARRDRLRRPRGLHRA